MYAKGDRGRSKNYFDYKGNTGKASANHIDNVVFPKLREYLINKMVKFFEEKNKS